VCPKNLCHPRGSPQKVGSNLGPDPDKLGPKPCTMTQHKARRTNQIAFLPLPWAQEAPGSNPGAPTILGGEVPLSVRDFACGLRRPQFGSSSNPGAPTTISLKQLRFFLRSISITLHLGNIWEQLIAEQVHNVSLRTPTRHPLCDSVGPSGRRIRFAQRVGHLADTADVGSEVDSQRKFAVRGLWVCGGGNL